MDIVQKIDFYSKDVEALKALRVKEIRVLWDQTIDIAFGNIEEKGGGGANRVNAFLLVFKLGTIVKDKIDKPRLEHLIYRASQEVILGKNLIMLDIIFSIILDKRFTLNEKWNVYWWFMLLDSYHNIQYNNNPYLIYKNIMNSLRNKMPFSYNYIAVEERNKVIVITTSQFLSKIHAPSRRVMDYAYNIKKTLGIEVIVVNDRLLNFEVWPKLIGMHRMVYSPNFEGLPRLTYYDEKFPFLQIEGEMPDENRIFELVNRIYNTKPLLVYNIGASNLVTDLCRSFTATATMPCSTNLPNTNSEYVILNRKLAAPDQDLLQYYDSGQKVIETVVGYNMEACTDTFRHTREEFGLTDNDFVISIVGTRLFSEVNDDFIKIIQTIINDSDTHILLVGKTKDLDKKIQVNQKHEHQLHFLTSNSANQIIGFSDLYLNPPRNGGGRSSFEALFLEIPVITLNHGDVYNTCGDDFAITSLEEIIPLYKKYKDDAKFRGIQKEKATKRASELADIGEVQKKVIEQILQYEKEKEANGAN
ncbi:MAG: hypothetical protein ATN35_01970 [Epulopiscium sp. Nele67-Bin004]|nr:MAG: hypothetical protein ATN35_01970 [Epulopiscium sp. Nele67-Bin004]